MNSNPVADATFGEVAVATRVGRHYSDFISPNTSLDDYDLVLDMNYQVYGLSSPAGGGVDNLTITIEKKPWGALFIDVTNGGAYGGLNGTYYATDPSHIRSITIRGSNDNETVRIIGDLGIQGNVYVDGGGGTNEIVYDDTAASTAAHAYTFASLFDPANTLRLSRAVAGQFIPGIDSVNVAKHTLLGGAGPDTVAVDSITPTVSNGLYIYTAAGNDWIITGTQANGMANVQRPVFADGGAGQDELWFRDAANTAANMQYTIDKSAVAGWGYTLHRTANGAFIPNVEFRAAEKISLDTGSQADTVRLYALPDITLGTHVNSNGGADTVVVGNGVFGFELGGDPNWITVGGFGNPVTLGDSLSLSVLPAFAMPVGSVVTLVDNQTDQPVTGIYDNLPEGSVITVGPWQFRLSYVGQALGSSVANDVTLTILAAPGGGPGSV